MKAQAPREGDGTGLLPVESAEGVNRAIDGVDGGVAGNLKADRGGCGTGGAAFENSGAALSNGGGIVGGNEKAARGGHNAGGWGILKAQAPREGDGTGSLPVESAEGVNRAIDGVDGGVAGNLKADRGGCGTGGAALEDLGAALSNGGGIVGRNEKAARGGHNAGG